MAIKLDKKQRRVLNVLSDGKWHSALKWPVSSRTGEDDLMNCINEGLVRYRKREQKVGYHVIEWLIAFHITALGKRAFVAGQY